MQLKCVMHKGPPGESRYNNAAESSFYKVHLHCSIHSVNEAGKVHGHTLSSSVKMYKSVVKHRHAHKDTNGLV